MLAASRATKIKETRAFKASIGKRAERCGAVTRCAASVCMEIGVGLKRRYRKKNNYLT